ncbi:hypothetical protein BLNAU_19052 [Blattamonas nauphoetae]|uniref:Uncharacterized protein n=1 Tax=Blattamonas nauphoetae TaxID=2049346 RepID=A0ABQ9X2P5_9EUKA|nr:hypothetical protein BLNAU_19052 [Blattamonas nauphoetae]
MGETNNRNDSQDDEAKVNAVNLNNAVSSQPSRDTNRNETEFETEETASECWEERLSPSTLQPTADKHGLVLLNTIIVDTMRDEQVDNFSHADAYFTTRQFTGAPTISEEQRLSLNGLDSDAVQQIGVNKQKDGSVDSTLKQEQEHLVDPSTSSASNADLLRMIDSLKATLVDTERQRSADKTKFEKEQRTMGSISAEEQSEPTRLKGENDRLTETISDFQVRAASLAADKSTLEKSLEQTRKKMEMPRENNTRLEERLEKKKREVDKWIGMNREKSYSIETLHTNIDQLTTERDTLKANLTATNQSLDESNQRIDTLSFEVSSLLSLKTELEHLLSKVWLITTDTRTDWVGVNESAAQLASIENQLGTIASLTAANEMNVDFVVMSFHALFSFYQQIETETRQLWETVMTILTKLDAVVEILCKAGRQASHYMGEVKSLADELDTVNEAMTIDLSCTNCLQLMNDQSFLLLSI